MKKSVPIELDKISGLRYGTNALASIEDLLGKSINALDSESMGIRELRVLLYAGLKWEDPDLTLDRVGDIIDDSPLDYAEIGKKIDEAAELALAKKK